MVAVTLHSTEYGPADGYPVLAIHGWTTDHRLMAGCLEPVFEDRKGSYRRLYPDLPGMGETPAGGAASADDLLDSLLAYVDDTIGDAPFLIIGESYGGYLARAVAQRRRDQVTGISLICPVGRVIENEERTVPEHEVLLRDPECEELRGSDFDDSAVVQTPETYRRAQEEIAVGLKIADQDALERIRERWELDDDPDDGAVVEVPAVIMAGRQDASTGYRDTWDLLEQYPRATFAVLDRAGHNLQIEQEFLFEALTEDWLDRVEGITPRRGAHRPEQQ